MSQFPIPPLHKDSAPWLDLYRLTPPEKDFYYWQLDLTMSTTRLSDYLTRKSRIKPGDLRLALRVSCAHGWQVTLTSQDDALRVEWRPDGQPTVYVGSFAHKHKTVWPVMTGIDDFRQLVPALEALLQVTFLREAHISVASMNSRDIDTLWAWSAPLCDVLELWAARLYGEVPEDVEVDDARQEGAGIQFTLEKTSSA